MILKFICIYLLLAVSLSIFCTAMVYVAHSSHRYLVRCGMIKPPVPYIGNRKLVKEQIGDNITYIILEQDEQRKFIPWNEIERGGQEVLDHWKEMSKTMIKREIVASINSHTN